MESISTSSLQSFIPANDDDRLAAVRRYGLFDTAPEKTFDEIAVLLSDTFEVPLAFVSLVDESKVFFKAKVGPFEAREVQRDNSYCSLSILHSGVTVLEDTASVRWAEEYPGFKPPKGLRFYAGAPILTEDGLAIGTVCIAHLEPRMFSVKEQKLLQQFARLALKEMENRKAALEYTQVLEAKVAETVEQLKQYESERQAFALYSQAPVAVSLYKGEDLIVSYANETALRISGKTQDVIGKRLVDVLPEVESQGIVDLLKTVYRTGNTFRADETPITLLIDNQPTVFYFNLIYQPYYSAAGEIEGVLAFGVDLTEQIQTRTAIEASEQKFRNVMAQAPYPILILKGDDLKLEVANPPLFRLWNIDETSIDRPFLDILPEMKEQGFWDLLQKVYKEGYIHYGYDTPVYFLRNGTQELHYFNFVYHPYREKDGTISGVLILATDVTENVLAQQKVAESEAHFRSMILQAPVGICILHRDELRVEIANDRYARLVNSSRADLEGKPIAEMLPVAEQYIPILYNVLNTGKPFHAHEYAIELGEGDKKELLYVDFVYEPLLESDGAINRVMALVIDVTEKVNARHQLETIESRTRLATEAAELGTFDVDLVTNEMFENRRLCEILGVAEAGNRKAYIQVLHPDDLPAREEAYRTAFETGALEYEARVIHKDGSIRWIKAKGSVLFSENNLPVRLHGVVLDITKQKQFAEELARRVAEQTEMITEANRLLLRKNEELNQFAYVASHDLQEPIRKILVFSNLVSSRFTLREEVLRYLDKISSAATRMNGLIKSLLDFSRLSKTDGDWEETDLNDVLAHVTEDLELTIEQKEAIIQKGDLPIVTAIPAQMNQLFFNLIGNALKFSKPGIRPVVSVSGTPLDPAEVSALELPAGKAYCMIEVADNGIGFDQVHASRMFTIFQQLNERTQYEGYGIGLALCKKIVDNHGGVIEAVGRPDAGALFRVVLPCCRNSGVKT